METMELGEILVRTVPFFPSDARPLRIPLKKEEHHPDAEGGNATKRFLFYFHVSVCHVFEEKRLDLYFVSLSKNDEAIQTV